MKLNKQSRIDGVYLIILALAIAIAVASILCVEASANSITVIHKPYVSPSGCPGHIQVIEHRIVVPPHYEWFWEYRGWTYDYWGNQVPRVYEWREWFPERVEYWYEEIRFFCDGRCQHKG